ncbi:FMN-dependent dehydrogenase [Chytridium lagenaria]|nr:FMN-dependent dehydrogenase [Chytridium lagenaria]
MSVESSTKLVCVEDFHAAALETMPKNARDYYESSFRNNAGLNYRTRVLRDVSTVNPSTSIFGSTLSFPVARHPEGELAMARAAAMSGTIMVLSTYATSSLEDVIGEYSKAAKVYAAVNPGLEAPGMWFQLYVYQNRAVSESLIQRAEAAGYKALMVTVDTPVLGRRILPSPHLSLANFDPSLGIRSLSERTAKAGSASALSAISALGSGGQESIIGQGNTSDASMNWEKDITWLRKTTKKMKIVLKGILSAEDVVLAAQCGVDAIVISNHGGRQLDTVPATLDALIEAREALTVYASTVPSSTPLPSLLMDGGIRKGTDVIKALALGAEMVFVGRPALWGLAQGGEEGVRGLIGLIKEEFRVAMTLLGCRVVKEINGDRVRVEGKMNVVVVKEGCACKGCCKAKL